ncbi:MAG: toxin-antitoxin system HicB family antitoxin [Chitinispirillales bacterium]|jgi:predicted HicB family RNase H-like nuclease|nr:toxin-antitoxin system HicB family antitoxin [Chitinispirillales bacterium]
MRLLLDSHILLWAAAGTLPRKAAELVVDEYLDTCAELDKEPEKAYRGTFNVRIDPALHRQLAVYSLSSGKSLNAAVEEAISNYIR